VARSVDEVITATRIAIAGALDSVCAKRLSALDQRVAAAVRYSVTGEGKRLRGALVCASYRAAGGTKSVDELAAAVEVVHAYSLVHDDLPCMDDDDVRRGRPTLHKAFDVPTATAAGVAMVPLAATTALRAARELELPNDTCGAIVRELMRAAGAGGMIGGQLLDLQAEGRSLTLEQLEHLHRAKTGALIAASVRIGALAAAANETMLAALDRYGEAVGLAFQIADDVLDETATSDQLGKTAGRDRALGKSTYPAALGVEGAMARARALCENGCAALRGAGLETSELEWLAEYIVTRRS
jgi:farnesyl diphosphate synthase/geranylgeranyl diphosphate synthase type II